MRDLDKALADIFAIRSQIAAGTAFRGYGPEAMAATGALALLTAIAQFLWLDNPTGKPLVFFAGWAVTALVCCAIIWVEMQARSRRHHSGLADAMIHQAVEQFLPAGVAGVLLALMLWPVRAGNAVDASGAVAIAHQHRNLRLRPLAAASIKIAAAWYFVAGFAVLVVASVHHTLSPWTMGLPFVIGQFLMAAILHFASGESRWRRLTRAPFSYEGLDRIMHEKARLGLLTSLIAHPKGLAFADLKQLCGLTDGNLCRHLQVLQEAGLVEITKGYEGNRPHTSCRLTRNGRRRFLDYLAVLERLVRDAPRPPGNEDARCAARHPAGLNRFSFCKETL